MKSHFWLWGISILLIVHMAGAYTITVPLVIEEKEIEGKLEGDRFTAIVPVRSRADITVKASASFQIADLSGKVYGTGERAVAVPGKGKQKIMIPVVLNPKLEGNPGFFILKYEIKTQAKTIAGIQSLLTLLHRDARDRSSNDGSSNDLASEFVAFYKERMAGHSTELLKTVLTALEQYRDQFGKFPEKGTVEDLAQKGLLRLEDVTDPWGETLILSQGTIISKGPDKLKGTADDLEFPLE